MKNIIVILIALLFCSGIFKEKFFETPQDWPQPFYDFKKNPLKKEKILLGRVLFYDNALSQNNSISCASCHSPYSAFTHIDHALSHGIFDRIGTRNSPALMNLAWQKAFMWDGSVNHLDMQALAPITHTAEMNFSMDSLVLRLQSNSTYNFLFQQAYGDPSVTGERILKSLSQFMLTLVSSNAKYDEVKRGKTTFTDQELNGYRLFKENCNSCHTEPLFTNGSFANNGLGIDETLNDFGKMKLSGKKEDSLHFKIPTLRNIEYSHPYMHDGRFKKLSEVINHYTSQIRQGNSLSYELRNKIALSANEKVDLIAFLLTLSDKKFVFNPAFQPPKKINTSPKDLK
jgi:cytochrome c peroxidase